MKEKHEANIVEGMTSSKLLVSNTLIGLVFKFIPLLVGLLAIPELIDELGVSAFGTLSVVWLILNYFSVSDLGLGRALVKQLTEQLDRYNSREYIASAWTGLISIFALGSIAGGLLFILGDKLTYIFGDDKESFFEDVLLSVAVVIPFVVSKIGLRSVLIARQKIGIVSFLQALNSAFNYLLPIVIVKLFENDLTLVINCLLAVKVVLFFVHFIVVFKEENIFKRKPEFSFPVLKEMFKFGKWITLSDTITPALGQVDRYFIITFISASAVAYYSTPLEVVSKVLLISYTLVLVLFPAFSTLSKYNNEHVEQLYINALKAITLFLFIVLMLLSGFSDVLIDFWLGEDFVTQSLFITKVFCLIYFLKSISYLNTAYILGIGMPKYPALFHVFELVLYIPLLFIAVKRFDINTVVIVNMIICFIDFTLLFYVVIKNVKNIKNKLKKFAIHFVVYLLSLILLVYIDSNWTIRVISIALVILFLYLNKDILAILKKHAVNMTFNKT